LKSNFIIFGGSYLKAAEEVLELRCVGILIRYENISIFIYCPLYEIGGGFDCFMDSGIGISFIPNGVNEGFVCENLLKSGDVKLLINKLPLEDILELDEKLSHINDNFNGKISLDFHESLFIFPVTNGFIKIRNTIPGSLSVSLSKKDNLYV
jgi:hypothetical protein